MPRSPALAVAALAALFVLALTASGAHARPVPQTVVQDDALFLHGSEGEIRIGLRQAREVGIERVRLTAGWSVIAPEPTQEGVPAGDLSDPASYPRDHWFNLDRAVRLTVEAGLRPMIDIAFWAPRWAIGGQVGESQRLRTDIDPGEFARFSEAVARRYGGGYVPPSPPVFEPSASSRRPDAVFVDRLLGRPDPRPAAPPAPAALAALPAVDLFTIWNEPNHPGFLQPQWRREGARLVPASPHLYRAMVRASYPAIKRGAPASRVLIGGTASMGSSTPGKSGVTPLLFLREFACVDVRLRPLRTKECENFEPVPGDGWAHHPYSLQTLPDVLPKDTDKLPVAATARLVGTLRRLADSGRVAPANKTVYMTEYGYETNPPDPQAPFSPHQQGRLLAWAEYLATRDGAVVMWPQFQLRDRPGGPAGPRMRPYGDWQTGLIYADGTPKPAFAEYGAPAFASCTRGHNRRWIAIWSRMRGVQAAANLQVEIRSRAPRGASTSGAWRPVASYPRPRRGGIAATPTRVGNAGTATTRFIPWRPGLAVRTRWSDGERAQPTSPALTAGRCPAPQRGARPTNNPQAHANAPR